MLGCLVVGLLVCWFVVRIDEVNVIRVMIVDDFGRMYACVCQPEGLHLLLDLARLMTVSFGEQVLSFERWTRVKELELTRMARLPRPVMPVPESPVSVSAV